MTSQLTILDNEAFASKFEQLRDMSLRPHQVRQLVKELTAIIATTATEGVGSNDSVAVLVILRSGMAMTDEFVSALPSEADVSIYHIGLFRDRHTLLPVEYYNKLGTKPAALKRGFILDPLLATGGTAEAAITIVRDWGLEKVTFVSLLASRGGLDHVTTLWPEGLDLVVGKVDGSLDSKGYVKPGIGDIGDRLYGTDQRPTQA